MQYPGSPTYWANWWALYIKDWRYEHPDFIKQLESGWRNFGSAQNQRVTFSMLHTLCTVCTVCYMKSEFADK